MTAKQTAAASPFAVDTFAERHFSLAEIAQLWSISREKARRLFQDEPGVVRFQGSDGRDKRDYCTYRVPESVARRVRLRLVKV